MNRVSYLLRRLLLIIPTFIGITLVCFALTRALPGGPMEQYMAAFKGGAGGESGESSATGTGGSLTEEQLKGIRAHFGYDKSLHTAYYEWLFHDYMGMKKDSTMYVNKTTYEVILDRMSVSLIFGITGFVLTYLVCIPLGILKALKDGSFFDVSTTIIVLIGYSLPAVSLGMLMKLLFCGSSDAFFDVLPATGFVSDNYDKLSAWGKFKDITEHMALPVLCYVIGNFAVLTNLMKNSLLEQISQDYIRTVIARGSGFNRAIWGHALRNSLIPIATGFGGIMTVMFAGSVIIEKIFEIPGMGSLSLNAIASRDYGIFMGILALTSILGMLGQILSDFCYMLIDPRINFD